MMIEVPTYRDEDTPPFPRRMVFWGCSGLLLGLIIGALAMALALMLLAPHPQTATPATGRATGNIIISMDDAYLTQVVSSSISQASLPISISNVQAEIQPANQVKITGFTSGGLPIGAQLTMVAQVRVQAGNLAMRIVSAQVGGLPLPASITTALEQPLNSKLAQVTTVLLPPGFVITSVTTTEHHLQMTISKG